jgi:hypothetical protein
MNIETKINYLVFGFKETGDVDYLFCLNRILTNYLDNAVDDYLEESEYNVSQVKETILKAFNLIQGNTLESDLPYRVGCKD